MTMMAQHPQQNHHHSRQKQEHTQSTFQTTQIKSTPTNSSSSSSQQSSNININQQQQLEQDGKRTLIKNQLHVIEQLQLENANLRNERDQLQLENEELKFQLQMISSSNILHQPSTTFKNQQLDPLVEADGKIDTNHHHHHHHHQQQQQLQLDANFKTNIACSSNGAQTNAANCTQSNHHQIKILAKCPARQQQQQQQQQHQLHQQLQQSVVKLNAEQNNQQVSYNTTNNNNNNKDLQQLAVRQSTSATVGAPILSSSSSSSSSSSISDTIANNQQNNIGKLLQTTVTSATTTITPSTTTAATTTTKTTATSTASPTNQSASTAGNNKFLATKSTSLTSFNVKPMFSHTVLQSRILPQDDDERRVKLVEQLYGDSEKVQAAAIVIQRAFRKYQICKRFRTITEQLRHTYQSVNQVERNNLKQRESPSPNKPQQTCSIGQATNRAQVAQVRAATTTTTTTTTTTSTVGLKSTNNNPTDLTYASGTTRAAAWESLSFAASKLAASAAAAKQSQTGVSSTEAPTPTFTAKPSTSVCSQQNVNISLPPTPKPRQQQQQQQKHIEIAQNALDHRQQNQHQQVSITSKQQDPVVAAAINFQQLESIRKRQYRVGLNIFNKNPEKGVSFLVAHSFIDSTSPYTKTSSSYYQSNQLHFIDKNYMVQQQQALLPAINYQSCQLCNEEDNLKRNVAHFLLHRKGLAKEKIGQYLGNLQAQFNQEVLKYYLQELDFYGLQIDLALRKFLSTFRLPGEAQKIEKVVDSFAQRYVQCQQQHLFQQQHQLNGNVISSNININQTQIHNLQAQQQQLISTPQQQQQQQPLQQQQNQRQTYKNNLLLLLSKDEIFILTFAIIMLNTDLHSPSLKPTSRMSASQFVNNLRGVFKSQTINESDLIEIYERVKANQITTTPDHVTHVMKVQQGLTVTNFQRKELPNLCVPHRRLVCFCRLFEVYDVNKKERLGQHQREIFLFNDLLLVTKLARRVRANTTQLYTYRQSISLQGLYVLLFQSPHYNYGIRLCQRSNDETIIMFNARNELDQSRFVDDLGESIAEMDEMETIKTHNIIETIHFKHQERLRRHAMMHTTPTNNTPVNSVTGQTNNIECGVSESNQHLNNNRVLNTVTSCDNRSINNYKQIVVDEDVDPVSTSTPGRGSKAKFSSMLNLSSACLDRKSDGTSISADNSSTHSGPSIQQNKFMRQNQSVGQQLSDHNVDLPGECPPAPPPAPTASGSAIHRRCSASSVHSLDSGLFLSRDVSPNQSS